MPQDSLRSVVYRSFVTCDDPKGVVQCGTIRKSKTSSHKMKHKVESQSLASMIDREEMSSKRSSQELPSPSLQLLEVSRGAEKLNRMISSWSGRMSFDGQSEDVAKDLLKGALDLQESLVMLGKLQEASKHMARLKKQERLMSRSDRFMGQNQNEYRLSVDGPSRDCIDQLREVIRDSFASQNLHRRSSDSDLEMPSTSSSQSSTDRSNSNRFGSTVSSLSPVAPYQKPKGPSLIARLMGLEEMAMKPQLTAHKVDLVKLKRVLKGDSQKEFRPHAHHFSEAQPRCRAVDDIAPIVLIRPMRARSHEFESLEPTCLEEEAFKTKKILRQLKMRSGQEVSRKLGQEVGKDSKEEVKTKGRAFTKPKALEQMNQKQQKNEVIDKRVDKVQKVAPSSTKETVKSPSSRSQDQVRVNKTRPGKSDNGSNIRKLGNPNLISKNTKQHIVHSSNGRKKSQAEKEKAKKKLASAQTSTLNLACQEDKRICSTIENDLAEIETISTFTAHLVTTEEKTDADATELHSAEKGSIDTFIDHLTTEEETHASELRSAEKGSIDTFIDHLTTEEATRASELHLAEQETGLTSIDHLAREEETNASELPLEEDYVGSASALCISTMLNLEQHERDTKIAVQVLDNEGHENFTDCNTLRTPTKLEAFLLGNPSFMSHIEDLFDLNITFPLQRQELDINDCGVANAELVLDYANELVKRRRLPDSRKIHPLLLACAGDTRMCLSLDQLIEEVCDGIKTLRSYTNMGCKNIASDNLYATLERDVWSDGVVNGTWDLGWRNGFSVDEAEQVVKDLEKLLFDQLISEAFSQ